MWTLGEMTGHKKWSIAWIVTIGLGVAFTGFAVTAPPAPMGDESLQILVIGAIFLILGIAGAAFSSTRTLNTAVFTVLFWASHLALWVKVSQAYEYSFFGPQLLATVVFALTFFALLLGLGFSIRLLVRALSKWHQAT